MINSQDIKNGVCIRMDGRLYFVIEFLHVKPGKGNTIMRVKFKDVVDGKRKPRRLKAKPIWSPRALSPCRTTVFLFIFPLQ